MSLQQIERELAEIAERCIALARRVRQARFVAEDAEIGETAADTFRNPPIVDQGIYARDPEAGQPVEESAA